MGTGGNHTLSTVDLSYSIQIIDEVSKVTITKQRKMTHGSYLHVNSICYSFREIQQYMLIY